MTPLGAINETHRQDVARNLSLVICTEGHTIGQVCCFQK